jgi:hypothetical protein
LNSANVVFRSLSVLIALVFISGSALAEDSELARGAELLAPLKANLKQALMGGMKEGPVKAISACKDQAPAITNALSIDGIEMGRASHRLRNPANVAPDWADNILQAYLQEGSDRTPTVVQLPDDRLGYAEPIMLQAMCLACHGEVLSSEVASRIEAAYPDDQATGFVVGDLRGVYWVEFSADE